MDGPTWTRYAGLANRLLWGEPEDARAHVVSRIPEILAKLGDAAPDSYVRQEMRWELTRWVRRERKHGFTMRHGAVMPGLLYLDAMQSTNEGELLGHEIVEGDASPESWLSAAEDGPRMLARMAPGPRKNETVASLRALGVLSG